MVVIRHTWHIEAPRFEEARKVFMEVKLPESKALRGVRGYRSRTGLANTLALEWEFESLAEWEEFSAQFGALPENAALFRKWAELVPGGATKERF